MCEMSDAIIKKQDLNVICVPENGINILFITKLI
jgi:hypothetical protein